MRGIPRGSRQQRAIKQTAGRTRRKNASFSDQLGCLALIVFAVIFVYFMAQ